MPLARIAFLVVVIVVVLLTGVMLVDWIGTAETPQIADHDNTALWTALIASLVLNILNFLSSTIGNVLQFLLKMAQIRQEAKIDRTEAKVDENTKITKEVKKAANGMHDEIVKYEKEKSHSEGFMEGQADGSNDMGRKK